jgi:radical SAM superfamily enzyme YgiQ (UPF0313 family)
MSPLDKDAYFSYPKLNTPKYDEVHISVTFTWDVEKAKFLADQWKFYGKVRLGGCAFDDPGNIFVPGMYLKLGVTITSRGCPNNCPFCFVPKREGKIRELPIMPGNIIQDNNLLATSIKHRRAVFNMLKKQKHIDFAGGFESLRLTDEIVEELRGLNIYQIWLAYDQPNAERPLQEAVNKLSKYFPRDKIRCYTLIGFGDDTIEKAEDRLYRAYEIGTLPFAMLYQPKEYSKDWHRFKRKWQRPAIIKSRITKKERHPN